MYQNEITKAQLAEAEDFLGQFDIYDATRADYSGRGMYGDSCLGFVVGASEAGLVALAIARALGDDLMEAAEIVREMRVDNMGLDSIVYFPRLRVDTDDDE